MRPRRWSRALDGLADAGVAVVLDRRGAHPGRAAAGAEAFAVVADAVAAPGRVIGASEYLLHMHDRSPRRRSWTRGARSRVGRSRAVSSPDTPLAPAAGGDRCRGRTRGDGGVRPGRRARHRYRPVGPAANGPAAAASVGAGLERFRRRGPRGPSPPPPTSPSAAAASSPSCRVVVTQPTARRVPRVRHRLHARRVRAERRRERHHQLPVPRQPLRHHRRLRGAGTGAHRAADVHGGGRRRRGRPALTRSHTGSRAGTQGHDLCAGPAYLCAAAVCRGARAGGAYRNGTVMQASRAPGASRPGRGPCRSSRPRGSRPTPGRGR